MFSFWDRLYSRLAFVNAGQDSDGMDFVRPPHPLDWILRPLTRWKNASKKPESSY